MMVVTNIFAWCATKPKDLYSASDPIGKDNNAVLLDVAKVASLVVAGWGNHGRYKNRGDWVKAMLLQAGIQIYCLGLTHVFWTKRESPQPKHPLYLPGDASLIECMNSFVSKWPH